MLGRSLGEAARRRGRGRTRNRADLAVDLTNLNSHISTGIPSGASARGPLEAGRGQADGT